MPSKNIKIVEFFPHFLSTPLTPEEKELKNQTKPSPKPRQMRFCKRHGNIEHIYKPIYSGKKNKRWYDNWVCPKCDNKETEEFRKYKKKNILIQEGGGKCQICGYNKSTNALQFHHIDRNQKEFDFTHNWNKPMDKLRQEASKTILLCANCHSEIEGGISSMPEEYSYGQFEPWENEEGYSYAPYTGSPEEIAQQQKQTEQYWHEQTRKNLRKYWEELEQQQQALQEQQQQQEQEKQNILTASINSYTVYE